VGRLGTCVLVCSVMTPVFCAAQTRPHVVVLSGTTAPGTGAFFGREGGGFGNTFGAPTIDEAGHVTFTGGLTGPDVIYGYPQGSWGNDTGLWTTARGPLEMVARALQPVPGAPADVHMNDFATYGAGTTAGPGPVFTSSIRQDDSTNIMSGLFIGTPGWLQTVIRAGGTAPGLPNGAQVSSVWGLRAARNGQYSVVVHANAPSLPGGYTDVLYLGQGGSAAPVLQRGQSLPGSVPGQNLSNLRSPLVNDHGQVFFGADLRGDGIDSRNFRGIWAGAAEAPQLVAQDGQAAPGLSTPATWSQVHSAEGFNNSGMVAFSARVTKPDGTFTDAIWRGTPGNLSVVAEQGQPAPGHPTAATFSSVMAPTMNAAGHVVFDASVEELSSHYNRHALWSDITGNLAPVATDGFRAPMTEPGTTFSAISSPAINALGQIVFWSALQGPDITDANNYAIWAADRSGVRLLVRYGDVLEVAPGDFRTVSGLGCVLVGGGEDGIPRGLNDAGQFTYTARFTDGSEAIIVTDVPEPAAWAGVALVAACLRRRL